MLAASAQPLLRPTAVDLVDAAQGPEATDLLRGDSLLATPPGLVSIRSQPDPLPLRQVHLDFHSSEHLPAVGEAFDPQQFQAMLQWAGVDQVNLFAKGHHGWSYYPTEIGAPHPTLVVPDLLDQQIAACEAIGVKVGIYYTVGWSVRDAEQHPAWCVQTREGNPQALSFDPSASHHPTDPFPIFAWTYLHPENGYERLMLRQIEELCQRYDPFAFFFDIMAPERVCYCETCQTGMKAQGIDPADKEAALGYSYDLWAGFMQEVRDLVQSHDPATKVFFNGTTVWQAAHLRRKLWAVNTHIELEDLPTFPGDYDKLPLRSKYFLAGGHPIVGMSGKFHTSWGDFGGYKSPEALQQEAATMLAYGASVNFGDQLHPSGQMDTATYQNLRPAFDYLAQWGEYGVGGRPHATLGVWASGVEPSDQGVTRMLCEEQIDFEVVNLATDWTHLKAIVLPSATQLTADEAERFEAFVDAGGKLLALGKALLRPEGQDFWLSVGARYLGEGQFREDFAKPTFGRAWPGLPQAPIRMYGAGMQVAAAPEAKVLAQVYEPYFDRTYERFVSHQNTPPRPEPAAHPAIWRNQSVVSMAHAIDRSYHAWGAQAHRKLFLAALREVYATEDQAVQVEMPSGGRVSLLHQPDQRRYVLHLLYAPPLKRGRTLVIEDLPLLPAHSLQVSLPHRVQRIRQQPQGADLPFAYQQNQLTTEIQAMQGHSFLVLSY